MVLGRRDKMVVADANADSKVNGMDIVVVANIILGRTTAAPVRKAMAVNANGSAMLSIEPFSISAGSEATMTIDLTNPEDELTLVQFNLMLPQGMSIKTVAGDLDIDMCNRTTWRKHSLDANQNEGYYTFLLKSDSNTLISGTEGGIITVTLVADERFNGGKIVIDNTLLVTPEEKEINPTRHEYIPDVSTGIADVIDNSRMGIIYDLSGRRITDIIQPGIYIHNGKNVYVK